MSTVRGSVESRAGCEVSAHLNVTTRLVSVDSDCHQPPSSMVGAKTDALLKKACLQPPRPTQHAVFPLGVCDDSTATRNEDNSDNFLPC